MLSKRILKYSIVLGKAKELGGNIYPVECLNTNKNWCKDFAKYTFTQAEGSAQDKEDIEYRLLGALPSALQYLKKMGISRILIVAGKKAERGIRVKK